MRKKLNPQTKFQIVLEAISGQKSHPEIARAYSIHPQLITNWKREFLRRGASVFQDPRERKSEEKRIEELEQLIGKKEIEI